MPVLDDEQSKGSGASDDNLPASLSRRAMLRRGVVAMPAILTLQSGAALARSSNLISAAPRGTTDRRGRTLCLDTSTVSQAGPRPGMYEMNGHAEVNILRDQKYYLRNPMQRDRDGDDQEGDWYDFDRDWESRHRDTDYRTRNQDYFGEHENDIKFYNADYACHKGGDFWTKSRFGDRYRMTNLPKNGVVLSTGAIMSHVDTLKGNFV